MCTTVFSAAPTLHHSPELVCVLHDITPEAAIERLSKAGILAIEGEDPKSIILLGFDYRTSIIIKKLEHYNRLSPGSRAELLLSLNKLAIAK